MFQRGLQIPPSPFRSSYAQSAVSKAQSSPLREIRPYMYQTLIYLVGIHAQVTSVADPLLDRILNTAIVKLAEEALRCFRQVKRFGMGGMNSHQHQYVKTSFDESSWTERVIGGIEDAEEVGGECGGNSVGEQFEENDEEVDKVKVDVGEVKEVEKEVDGDAAEVRKTRNGSKDVQNCSWLEEKAERNRREMEAWNAFREAESAPERGRLGSAQNKIGKIDVEKSGQ
ncbi:hypothetical protein C0989_006828 [Termitomyces sp. Mn162]|nr:hypothetical protein C0989_006828 [Termitomyces sp. Mn162]